MARDGSGIYHRPVGTDAVTDTTIESTKYNINVADVEQDLNLPRPLVAGGTGATSADGALDSLSAEKFKQVVTNWDTTVWRAGSYYAATTAIGTAPVAGHAFAGCAYYANATDLVCEATDITDPANPDKYIRIMSAGVWGVWIPVRPTTTGDYLFNNTITFPPAAGQIRFNNATQNSTTEVFISHLTASGADNTGALAASIKSGYTLYIQDKDEPTKYKTFVTTANPVLSGGDFRVTVTFLNGGVDIVSAQRVLLSVTTGSAVCYDIAQSLTSNQKAQARANIDVLKKNYIINGAMQISQQNGGNASTANLYYPVDQFFMTFANAGTQTIQQIGKLTPAGSLFRIRVTATVADASVAATDYCTIYQYIEGTRVVDLGIGTAAAKTVTLQFGVNAPAGVYCVSARNGAANRSYVAEYTIAAGEANIDVVKSITVPLDTTGTWAADTTIGLSVAWCLMTGTTYQTPAGVWASGNFLGSANQFNFMGVGGRVFELFDMSLTEGTSAPGFTVPDYPTDFFQCQRYFSQRFVELLVYAPAGNVMGQWYGNPAPTRVTPTMTLVGGSYTNCSAATVDSGSIFGCRIYATITAAGIAAVSNLVQVINARM